MHDHETMHVGAFYVINEEDEPSYDLFGVGDQVQYIGKSRDGVPYFRRNGLIDFMPLNCVSPLAADLELDEHGNSFNQDGNPPGPRDDASQFAGCEHDVLEALPAINALAALANDLIRPSRVTITVEPLDPGQDDRTIRASLRPYPSSRADMP